MRLPILFGAVGLALGLGLPAIAAPISVPAGTQVKVHLVKPISSGEATVGQRFRFAAAEAVNVNGHVVITKGASGVGHVVKVSKAQGKSAGEITLEFTDVHGADGKWIPLTEVKATKGNSEKGKASTATIAATIALGPLGLFAHNMVKGKDITVTPESIFPAWVKANTSVSLP
ncbi:MAG: hypothetical protein ABI346_05910 [Candidatus Baltobacteraceae bacterium]